MFILISNVHWRKIEVACFHFSFFTNRNKRNAMESDSDEDSLLSEVSTISSDYEESDNDEIDLWENEEDDHIFMEDEVHMQERNHGQYYIGIQHYVPRYHTFLFVNTISPTVYFRHAHPSILRYLVNYSILRVKTPTMDILQLQILPDETYSCVIKTHWIRIVQRHWKKAFQKRKDLIRKWKTPAFQRQRELTGKYMYGLPTLYGLLSSYKNARLHTQ